MLYFKELVEPELGEGFAIVVIPSHDPEKKEPSGLKMLVAELTNGHDRTDASDCLVRTKKIDKLATGGHRSPKVHLESLSVAQPALVKGRDVLLLDDVTNTGNSLRAGAKLLLEAGARTVKCVALGQS